MSEPDRMASLGGRVRWLDRYRRVVALVVALLAGPVLIAYLMDVLHSEWPLVIIVLPGLVVGVIVWWAAEVALASVTAVWETELVHLGDRRGLPRAEIWNRRRWG